MKKKYFFTVILLLVSVVGFSQPDKKHAGKVHRSSGNHSRVPSVSNIPDSVYINRLAALPFEFKMTYNALVRKSIEFYTTHYKRKTQQVVSLGKLYFPVIDSIFRLYKVPAEMKYVTVIESSVNPLAVSPYGPAGLWQFVAGTGKLYGLKINNHVDERLSFIKSTHAAAMYFRKLFNIYNDWQLVLAAYNCGSGLVSKAIRNSGKHDFQSISKYLPARTREYVPQFIGAAYACNYYKEHDITPAVVPSPLLTDTVQIRRQLSISRVSEIMDIPLKDLRRMNPQYIGNLIPASEEHPFTFRIPAGRKEKFVSLLDSADVFSSNYKIENPEKVKSQRSTKVVKRKTKVVRKSRKP